jgi:hypothetical protein
MRHLNTYELFESNFSVKHNINPDNELAKDCIRYLSDKILFPDVFEFSEEAWFEFMYAGGEIRNSAELRQKVPHMGREIEMTFKPEYVRKMYQMDRSNVNIHYWFSRWFGFVYSKVFGDSDFSKRHGYYSWTDSDKINKGKLKVAGFLPHDIDMIYYLKDRETPKKFSAKWIDAK